MTSENEPQAILKLSSAHTYELGRVLGDNIQAGQVIALRGDLGAGKTTLAQGVAEGMGIEEHVTSPTFTLVNEYGIGSHLRMIHVDTYRLGEMPDYAVLESATFGLEDILDPENLTEPSGDGAVVLIEWAERVAPLLPEDYLLIQIIPDRNPELRTVSCTAFGPRSAQLLRSLKEQYPS